MYDDTDTTWSLRASTDYFTCQERIKTDNTDGVLMYLTLVRQEGRQTGEKAKAWGG